jgi:hypothetical protein
MIPSSTAPRSVALKIDRIVPSSSGRERTELLKYRPILLLPAILF